MAGNPDVRLTIGIQNELVKTQLADLRKMLKNTFSEYTAKQIVQLSAKSKKLGADFKNLASSGLGLPPDFDKKFTNVNQQVAALGTVAKGTGAAINKNIKGALQDMTHEARMAGVEIKKNKRVFQGWALSIMFFGQAIQRVFTSIWKSASKTFTEVMQSVEGTTTDFDMLNGSLTYMKFVAGQALEPIAMALIPIIDSISTWVEDNQELFSTIVVIGSILGFVLATVGMLVLAAFGLIEAFAKIKGVIMLVGGALTTFGIGPILAIVALAAVLYTAWKTNFLGIQDFIGAVFGNIWETVKGVFSDLKVVFSGVFDFLEGLFTGDMDKVMQGLAKILVGLAATVLRVFLSMGAGIWNIFVFIVNAIKDLILTLVQLAVGVVQKLAEVVSLVIPGWDGNIGFLEEAQEGLKLMKDADMKYMTGDQIAEKNQAISDIRDSIVVNIELDGEQVAKSTSTRIQSNTDKYSSGGASGSWGN